MQFRLLLMTYRSRFLLTALALFVVRGTAAHAAVYYVDPAGDDANPGAVDQPWQTIQHAATVLQPGDTVTVQPGVYVESVVITQSGTATDAITYQGLAGAVLESPDPGASLSAFDVRSNVGYVVIDGFEARGGFHETIFLRTGSHHVTIRSCDLHDNRAGIWVQGATDIAVEDCHVHANTAHGVRILGASQRVTLRDTVSSGNDDGLGCAGDADGFIAEETTSQVTFVACLAAGNGEDGFDLQGDQISISRSRSEGNTCAGIKLYQNARVENSLVLGNTTGIATTSFFGLPATIEVFNSTVADNASIQLLLRSSLAGGDPPPAYDVLLRNLIAAGPGKAIEAERNVVLTEDHNTLFRGNTAGDLIVHYGGDPAPRRYSGQQVNAGLWISDSGQGLGTWAIDPDFTDVIDYRVAAESVAVDGGRSDGAPPDDYDGAARPQGNAPDVGAYEEVLSVTNHRPWADPGPDRTAPVATIVAFNAFGSVDPDGNPLTYSWDFGDGSPAAEGYAVGHAFAAPGEYTVTLTVSDGALTRAGSAAVSVLPPPTPTPTPAQAPTATATPTATPHLSHDSVVLPPRPMNLVIRAGRVSLEKDLKVKVLNADIEADAGQPGHVVRLTAEEGTCPAGTLAGAPDFDRRLPGAQDSVLLVRGQHATARIPLTISRDAFTSINRKAPHRCTLQLSATSEVPGNVEPSPANNAVSVELNVFDRNDPEQATAHESYVASVRPVRVAIRAGAAASSRARRVAAFNGDIVPRSENPGHAITISLGDTNCPPGTVVVGDVDARSPGIQDTLTVRGGRSVKGTVSIAASRDDFPGASSAAPSRCTVTVTAAGPGGDADLGNNTSVLVIDVSPGS